jgi:hypothetical protein
VRRCFVLFLGGGTGTGDGAAVTVRRKAACGAKTPWKDVAENAMAETACEGAVGTTPTPTLARLGLSLMTNPDAESRARLQCVFEERKDCGRRTLTVTGILSALPRRSFVDVQIDDGLVSGCRITGAPGW